MIGFQLIPWRKFSVIRDDALVQRWLARSAHTTHAFWVAKMTSSRGGRLYTQELRTNRATGAIFPIGPRGRPHRASAPGDFAAIDKGIVKGSIREVVQHWQFEIGSNAPHSIFLFKGTSRMKKRKMSKEALLESKAKWGRIGPFAKFRLGGPDTSSYGRF